MKNAAEHARRLRKLVTRLKKESGASPLPPVESPTEQLLRGVLSDYAAEARASAALNRLMDIVVDLNELRVTPVSEIADILGADFPDGRSAAEELVDALNAVFNRQHHLDLGFLRKAGRRTAESFLNSLRINPHARATVVLRCLKGHAVPADRTMCEYLRRTGVVEPDSSVEEIQQFLASKIRDSQAGAFYVQLKRFAPSHMPKHPVSVARSAPTEASARSAAGGTTTRVRARRPAARSPKARSGARVSKRRHK